MPENILVQFGEGAMVLGIGDDFTVTPRLILLPQPNGDIGAVGPDGIAFKIVSPPEKAL